MKIGGTHLLPFPQELAYNSLQDPELLARCMPGCDGLEKIADNEYAMKMKMALAAFSGMFAGKIRIAEAKPHSSFQLIVEGSGKVGFMKGEGVITLSPATEGTGTEVSYDGDVQVGGTIAAVGQRMVDTTAKMMIKRFFDRMTEEIQARA